MSTELQPELIWADTLRELSSSMPGSAFSTWIKPLTLKAVEAVGDERAIITFTADSPYVAQQAELRCYAQLKQAIDRITGKQNDLVFTNTPPPTTPSEEETTLQDLLNSQPAPTSTPQHQYMPPSPARHKSSQPQMAGLFSSEQIRLPVVDRYKLAAQKAHLREDFTFDSIAVSGSNEMAYAAASAVAQNPGQAYNPLFLWGGVGVGKTHLMQAIGNSILKKNPDQSLLYCMGEEFLNEIIAAIRSKKTLEFKERYRKLSVLLIDDIQFIAGKNTAQEEFFHTFNAITRAGGQIIMTSDRPPHEIHPLEDRLRSRFEGGLTIDIQQPTFELRTAILLIKAQKLALDLPMEIAQIIASEVESTRKLEGVVFKLHSAHHFQNRPLNEALARDILGQESKPVISRQNLKPSAVLRAVTSHFHISANTLRGPSRKQEYVYARHIAMYLLKHELNLPYTEIGASFGGRDHTSVMHAFQKVEQDIKENPKIQQDISAIRISLTSQ